MYENKEESSKAREFTNKLMVKPIPVSTLIPYICVQVVHLGSFAHLNLTAKKTNKDRIYLETIKDQVDFISNMGIGNEENFIKYILDEIDKSSVQIPLVHQAWKNGDTQILENYMNEFKTIFPKAYEIMISKRNNKWIGKIEKMFDSKDIEYVLVGFAHLAGEDSVLKKLKALGYKIQRVKITH